MLTKHQVLEHLQPFCVESDQLTEWERVFDLSIPVNDRGEAQYSLHHVNLFKNIKKNIALGHSIETIKSLLMVPEEQSILSQEAPVLQAALAGTASQADWDNWSAEEGIPYSGGGDSHPRQSVMISDDLPVDMTSLSERKAPLFSKALVSLNKDNTHMAHPEPSELAATASSGGPMYSRHDGSVHVMMDRIMEEKRDLHQRLIETEKLNSHLYNANNMFHRKVKALSDSIDQLKIENGEHKYFKALDEKARLHKQLIQADKTIQELQKLTHQLKHDKASLQRSYQLDMEGFSRQLQYLQSESMDAKTLMPTLFCGQWNESIVLHETHYDNYGIDIPNLRERTFRISEPPKTISGVVGLLPITYAYEQNTRWKRHETHYITPVGAERLKGLLVIEYWLEDTPVAKATYRVACVRQRTANVTESSAESSST